MTKNLFWTPCAVLLLVAAPTWATTFTFLPTLGDWDTPANWMPNGGPPDAGDIAVIPSCKTCLVQLADQAAAVVDVQGTLKVIGQTDLTLDAAGLGPSTVDGSFILKTAGADQPRIKLESDITFNGSGDIIGDDSSNDQPPPYNQAGWFWSEPTGSARKLTLGSGINTTGSLTFMVSLTNNGTVTVDYVNDCVWVGQSTYAIGTLSGSGSFIVSDGVMKFDTDYDETANWSVTVSGGELWITQWILNHSPVPGSFTFTGGEFIVDSVFCATGAVSMNNCEVRVEPEKQASFLDTCP